MGTEGGRTVIERDIMTVEQAAEAANVTPAVILDWITKRGLKATPIGSVARRGPRRYLIRRQWLLDNLEAWAVSNRVPAETGDGEAKPSPQRRGARGPAATGPLGARPGR